MTTAPAARISLLHRYANPAAFGRLSSKVLPWSAGIAILLLGLGTYFALFDSPPDYQQGNSVRIMYVHVPAAIMSEVVYGMMAAAAAAGFIWKHALADLFVKAAAPLGAAFTFICLQVPGASRCGAPRAADIWFFLYLGYLALVDAFDDLQRGLKAILVLVGVVDLPIINSRSIGGIRWPASLMTLTGPKVDPSMLLPLCWCGFTAFFVAVVMLRLESELLARRIRAWRTAADSWYTIKLPKEGLAVGVLRHYRRVWDYLFLRLRRKNICTSSTRLFNLPAMLRVGSDPWNTISYGKPDGAGQWLLLEAWPRFLAVGLKSL